MKRTACLILSFILILGLTIPAFAYEFAEDAHFTMEIPENYTRMGELEFIDNDNPDNNFNATYEKNETSKANEDKSEKDIKKETDEIINTAKKMFKIYDKEVDMVCVSAEKVKQKNGMTAVIRTFKTSCELTTGLETRYQKMYFFSGAVNEYTFSYDVKNKKDLDKFDKYFETIDIKEAEARSIKDNILTYSILAIVIFLIGFGIVKFVSSPNNRQEEKPKVNLDNKNNEGKDSKEE